MIQKILDFFSQKPNTDSRKSTYISAPVSGLSFDNQPEHPPRREATRPSYRVGKHKSSDVHKVIDMSG